MNINNELVLQYDIDFYGMKIHQTTIDDMFKYGLKEFDYLLFPYCLTLDMFQIPVEEQEKHNVFDYIISNEELFIMFISSLKYFCKTENISVAESGICVDNAIINRDNFAELCEVILKVHARTIQKEDKLPDNPKQRELELKFRALRARHKQKSEIQLCDIINIVKYAGKYYISTEEIRKMTLWELSNAYTAIMGIKNYENVFSIALVAGDKNNQLEENHWLKQLKVEK